MICTVLKELAELSLNFNFMTMKKELLSLLYIFMALSLKANIRLPNILSSNMVLQQQSKTKLWGWAAPGEKIKIRCSWDNSFIETSADGNARWEVDVHTSKAGGPYTITFQGYNRIQLENILIGEVWLCGGQSNMEYSYNQGISSIRDEFKQLSKLKIRFFNIPKTTSRTPQDNVEGQWTVCDTLSIKAFSAVGYYFARYLNEDLNVPVGVISSNWGGTPAETWTPVDLVENNKELKQAADKKTPSPWSPRAPGYAYNAMIAPLVNYGISGSIWYQGEANKNNALSYAGLMDTLIAAWRKDWRKDFPFYYVQIAPYRYDTYNVGALIREAQTKNLSIPKTGMVVVSDLVGDTLDIHPKNKKDVGLRLANLALAETYGIKKEGSKSPVFSSFSIGGGHVEINFLYAQAGLVLRGQQPKEFYIAGADRVFYPASVKIKGNKILVSGKQVKTPVAVRYQFSNAGIGNLFSKSGLPAAPFRTDNWEVNCSKIK